MVRTNDEYHAVVVGAGITGSVIAERLAQRNMRVLVIDKRDHIGGNCYDYMNEDGILVPKYGPHFFHTNYADVWDYVSRFTEWHPYEHKVLSMVENTLVPVPVNITTVNMIFSTNLVTEDDMQDWLKNNTVASENPQNSEEVALSRVGRELYEKIFKNYTKKQWDVWPKELAPSVMSRIPVRLTNDDRYFTDKYQAMPKKGYTSMFKKMLEHPNIKIALKTDFFSVKDIYLNHTKIFYTGRIDDFFPGIGLPHLQYRSLDFVYETLNRERFQPVAQVNYPNTEAYTRITEPKHATGQKHPRTTIIKEYPTWVGEPFYPVPKTSNESLYLEYKKQADMLAKKDVYFIGRLANYKYINMDQAFKDALDFCNKLKI